MDREDVPLPAEVLDALEGSEQVVWTGAPGRFPALDRLLLRVVLTLLGGGMWLPLLFMDEHGGLPLWGLTSGLVATLVGGVAATFAEARRQRQTRYVVTNRRAFVYAPGDGVEDVPWWMLAGRRKDVRYTGQGTIRFAPHGRYDFYHVADVRAADAALAALPTSHAGAGLPEHVPAPREDASFVPAPVLRALSDVLDAGETVRWWGHPDAAALKHARAASATRHSLQGIELPALIGLGLLSVAGVALAWSIRDTGFHVQDLLGLMAPTVLVVGTLLARWRMRQRLYVVTDRRALILTPKGNRDYRVRSIGPEEAAQRRLVKNKNGTASIRFDGLATAPASLDDDAFVGPDPVTLVSRLLDALVLAAPEPASRVALPDDPAPEDAPVLRIPRTRV